MCCSVLQCVAVCCSVLQCMFRCVRCSVRVMIHGPIGALYCEGALSVLQCVAVRCSVL